MDTIIIEYEKQEKANEIRRLIRRVQDSFTALKEDIDFVLPANLNELSNLYVRNYYLPLIHAIQRDITIDDEIKRNRLINKWRRKQTESTRHCGIIRSAIDNWPMLRFHFDPVVRNIVIGKDVNIDTIAEEMVRRPVPSQCAEHYAKVFAVRGAISQLRAWEKENNVIKQPLKNLVSWDKESFASHWACGMTVAPDEDERTRTIRQAHEK